MKLRVYREVKTRLPMKKIRFLFDQVIRREAQRSWRACINLIITDDARIRKLNKKFRKKDKATDILSFNIDEPDNSESIFGEIYISDQTARKQAGQYGATISEEYLRLVEHGLLHLFGYDHMRQNDADKMRAREEFYLKLVERQKQ